MFAVIKTGGKQYKVAKDDIITVEKLLGEPGEKVQLGDVLMLGEEGKALTVGTPLVEKAAVTAEVLEPGKGDKVIVFKKKRRQNYRRTKGHRQEQTTLKVLEVSANGTKTAATKKPSKKADDAGDAQPAKKAPDKKTSAKKKAAADKPTTKKPTKKKAPAKDTDKE